MPADKQPSREQVIAQVVAELEVHRTIFGQSNLGNGAYALNVPAQLRGGPHLDYLGVK